MPRAEVVIVANSFVVTDGTDKWRERAFAALSEMGTVCGSTLKIKEIRREGSINFGTVYEPEIISLEGHNLVAATWVAEVEPNQLQQNLLESRGISNED